MRSKSIRIVVFVVAIMTALNAVAADLSGIDNYREYSQLLSSSGQPSGAQLTLAADQGFDRVIYLAFTNNETAIDHEDSIVKSLGMEYIHIPVDFQQPTIDDFRTFVSVIQEKEGAKTLVHCQVNFRASTFSFLYRVIFLEVPMLDAKEDMDGVWSPNETWFRFIRSVFESYGLTEKCVGCDWGEHEFIGESGN